MRQDWFYENIAKPLLFRMDAEDAHYAVYDFMRRTASLWSGIAPFLSYNGADLETDFLGTRLSVPIGLAAGFDKNGYLVDMLGNLGFGFAEIGSVTALPSEGNPKPRLFRLPEDQALINRLGLNGEGAEVVAHRLKRGNFSLPVGINIAKTNRTDGTVGSGMVQDMLSTFKLIKDLPISFVTLNASCPNTHEGIVREAAELEQLFEEVMLANIRNLPVLVKLSPDSSDELIDQIVEAAKTNLLAGFVCGNTTTTRNNLKTDSSLVQQIGNGGLSGAPLKKLGVELVRKIAARKTAAQVVIGVGGIFTGQDVQDYIDAGANVVELYTGLVYRGPRAIQYVCDELQQLRATATH